MSNKNTKVKEISYKKIFDEAISRGETPDNAAETVLDILTNGTWAIWDQERIDRSKKTIIDQLMKKEAKNKITKIKLSKSQWEKAGRTAGWMPRDPNDFSDKDLNPVYTAQEEEDAFFGKDESIEEVEKSAFKDGYKVGFSKGMDASQCPYESGTNLSNKWWEGYKKGKTDKTKFNAAKTIKKIKVAGLSENVVPVEKIIGTSPKGTSDQIDKDMHSKGYFLFREHYRWGKTLSYQNKNGDKVYLERNDNGEMVWMTETQLKEQIKKTWRPSSREDQDWFIANLG